jgi:IclR family acetate operon transcriptional repressor
MEEKTSGTQAIHKGTMLLRAFDPDSPEIGVRELARKVRLPKSTVHRLLVAMEQEGLVEQNPITSRYHLGIELVAIAGSALRSLDVRRVALRYMKQLAERWNETVDLDVLRGTQIVIIEQIPGQHLLSTGGSMAASLPAHCTSTGKILLAHAGEEYVLNNLPEELPRLTRHTITSRSQLLSELEQVRSQGYSRSWGEYEEYVHALGVPIYDRTGEVIASISISGLAARINGQTAEEMIKHLKGCAAEISAGLGFIRRLITNNKAYLGQNTTENELRRRYI